MKRAAYRFGPVVALVSVLAACGGGSVPGPAFTEVAGEVGLDFRHRSGATGAFLLPEIMAGGAGFLDFDGDGFLDVYLVQSAEPGAAGAPAGNRLYRNEQGRRFVDVTEMAGVGDVGYGMGLAAGDYDNDGDVDLYVTNLGPNVLYRNNGDGTFLDVTERAGVGDAGFSSSAAFVDYDADGDLDLVVTNYVDWAETPRFTKKRCFAATGAPDYCSPQAYDARSFDTLYRNEGDGRFTDVSARAGLRAKAGTGLGVVCTDLDNDGRVDIYVANDQMPSFAWINQGDGTFVERAIPLGIAVDETGKSQAGMGVATADVDHDGDFDLFKVHLYRESHILYLNYGHYFDDATARWGLAAPTRRQTGFGTGFVDFDLDGRLDIFVANGRVQRIAGSSSEEDVYAEPNQLLRQIEPGRFADVSSEVGAAFDLVETSRAAAFGDYDNDGDIDILVANRDGPVRLLRNDAVRLGNFLTLRLVDRHGRDAYGARVDVRHGAQGQAFQTLAAYSYCATNDPRVHVGLGREDSVERVEVRWPDGTTELHGPFEANTFVRLVQGSGAQGTTEETPRRPEFLEIARRLRESRNEFFGHQQIEELERLLEGPVPDPVQRIRAQGLLATELLRIGEVDRAVATIESALALAGSDPALAPLLSGVHRIRGLVYLRKAEVENCISRHDADCCIFPLRAGGVHEEREPARQARESYLACLADNPDDLKLRWLLNLVAMALDDYPRGVPAAQRIPPEVFASEAQVGKFRDVAPQLGVDTFNLCGGCIVDDFDLDGALDIVTSTSDPEGPLTFYRNRGDGSFEDRSGPSRLDDQLGGLNCQGADYDNDGDVDILILRGAWLLDDGQIRNSLVRNNGDGTFTDVTHAAGLAEPARPTQAAAWADYDNDGDLDLYVGNESRVERIPAEGDYPSQLFRNEGDGTFSDIAEVAGVTNDRYAKGVAAGDYDNDGDVDLYVSNVGRNRLYRNDGDGSFTDVADELGLTEPAGRSFATWFFDYDNDGWLDLFVAAYDAKVEDVVADLLGMEQSATRPSLYRNDRKGGFTDVAVAAGLSHAWLPMGANFGDMDNDGWLDVYLATGDPDFQTLVPNVMLRNDRGQRFQDVTTAAGLGHLQKGHGVAFADLDDDGDQDIYHQLGGFYPGDRFANALFQNPGNDNRQLVVELSGVRSNRAGYGARLSVTVETPSGPRTIYRAAGSVSSFGGSPRRQEIGLGDATRVVRLEVRWPVSGTVQTFTDVPIGARVRVVEGRESFEVVGQEKPAGEADAPHRR